MATGQLQKQLAKLREVPEARQLDGYIPGVVSKKNKEFTGSLIYEPSEASHYDIETLRRHAVEGFDTLISATDPHLCSFSELFDLFPTQYRFLHKKRKFLTQEESSILNDFIRGFLIHIGSYWQEPEALDCLEYLIRKYEIQKYNVDELLSMALPYHETPLFIRLIQILHLNPSHLLIFLKKAIRSGVPLKRSIFVANCVRNPAILAFLSESVIRSTKEASIPNISLYSFFTLCCLEVLSIPSLQLSEYFLRQFLPCIFFALNNPLQQELHTSGLLILATLCKRVTLSREVCCAAVSETFLSILNYVHTPSLRHFALVRSFIFVNILILEQRSSQAESTVGFFVIPEIVLRLLTNQSCRQDVLIALEAVCCDKKFDITPLVGVLFRSFFHALKTINARTDDFPHTMEAFCLDFLRLNFSSQFNTRICVCLALFEAFLICPAHIYEGVPRTILRTLERQYPTSTHAFRYFLKLASSKSIFKKLLSILCEMLLDHSMSPILLEHGNSYEHEFDICVALTDENINVREQAVCLGLERFKKEVTKDPRSSAVNVLSKLLQQCASDSSFSIATNVFSCSMLWLNSPIAESLSNLFYLFHLLIYRTTKHLPWTYQVPISNIPIDKGFSVLFPYFIMEDNEVKQRFLMVLKCLTSIAQVAEHQGIARDILHQLFPVFLPLCLGVSLTQEFDALRCTLVECLIALQADTISLLQWMQGEYILNTEMLSFFLLHHSSEIESKFLMAKESDVWDSDDNFTGSVLDYRMDTITVCHLSECSNVCPVILASKQYFRAGPWTILSWLESFCFLAKNEATVEYLDAHHILLALRLCWDLWLGAFQSKNSSGSQRLSYVIKQCLFSCFPLIESQDLFNSCILLCLLDLFSSNEGILTCQTCTWFLPSIALILVGQVELPPFFGVTLPFHCQMIIRTNAAKILRHFMEMASNQIVTLDMPIQLLILTVLGGVLDSYEDLRRESFLIIKPSLKVLKHTKKINTNIYCIASLSPNLVKVMSASKEIQTEFVKDDIIAVLRCFAEQEKSGSFHIECLGRLLGEKKSLLKIFFDCLILCPVQTLKRKLGEILKDVAVEDLLSFFLPLSKFCLNLSEPCAEFIAALQAVWDHIQPPRFTEHHAQQLWEDFFLPFLQLWQPCPQQSQQLFYQLLSLVLECHPHQPNLCSSLSNLLCILEEGVSQNVESRIILMNVFSKTLSAESLSVFLCQQVWEVGMVKHIGILTFLIQMINERYSQPKLHMQLQAHANQLVPSLIHCAMPWFRGSSTVQHMTTSWIVLLDQLVRCLSLLSAKCCLSDVTQKQLYECLLKFYASIYEMLNEHIETASQPILEVIYELCIDLISLASHVLTTFQSWFWEESRIQELIQNICCNLFTPLFTRSPHLVGSSAFKCSFQNFIHAVYQLQNLQLRFIIPSPFYHITEILVTHYFNLILELELQQRIREEIDSLTESLASLYDVIKTSTIMSFQNKSIYLGAFLSFLVSIWLTLVKSVKNSSKTVSTEHIDRLCSACLPQKREFYMDILLSSLRNIYHDLSQISCKGRFIIFRTSIEEGVVAKKAGVVLAHIMQKIRGLDLTLTFTSDFVSSRDIGIFHDGIMSEENIYDSLMSDACSNKETELIQFKLYSVYWMASCVLGLLYIAKTLKKKLCKAIVQAANDTASELLLFVRCPFVSLLIVCISVRKLKAQWTKELPEENGDDVYKKKHWTKIFSLMCGLISRHCFIKKILNISTQQMNSLSHPQEYHSLLSTREGNLAQQGTHLLDITLKGLLDSINIKHKSSYARCHLVACLTLTFGSRCNNVLKTTVLPYLTGLLAQDTFIPQNNENSYLTRKGEIVNLLGYAYFHGIPAHCYVSELNQMVQSLARLWNQTASCLDPTSSLSPQHFIQINNVFTFLGILTTSPAFSYASCHLDLFFKNFLLHKHLLGVITLQKLRTKQVLTFYQVSALISSASYHNIWFSRIHQFLNNQIDGNSGTPTFLFDLWSHVTWSCISKSLFKNVVHALVPCVTQEAQKIATLAAESTDALRCVLALQSLGLTLSIQSPETVSLAHKNIAQAFMSVVHAAVKSVHSIAQNLTSSTSLAVAIQSGFENEFFIQMNCPFASSLGHPFAFSDFSCNQHFNGHYYGLMEAFLTSFISLWLPKMTNAQLTPLIKSLIKYTANGLPTFMSDACIASTKNQEQLHLSFTSVGTPEDVVSRNAANSRLFFNIYTTIASGMGEIAILSTLWNVVPHLREALTQSQRQLFQLALLHESHISNPNNDPKKKRRKASEPDLPTITTSWWWFDLGLPCLLCITKISQVTVSIPFVEIFLPLVLDALDVFTILPCPQLLCSEKQISFQDADDMVLRLSQTWLWALMIAVQTLVSHILSDPLRIRSSLQPLLNKAQSSQNSSVRYTALILLYKIWSFHGVGLLGSLEDSMEVFNDLLDDADPKIEHVTSLLIRHVEKLTGETLQSRLGCVD